MLSIIIPTRNEEDYIEDLLESIRFQDYKNYEIIIVDGSSQDRTLGVAIEYAYRHQMNLIPINFGVANASMQRNHGASESIGNTLVFIDADIVIKNRKILRMIAEKSKQHPIIATCVKVNPEDRRFIDSIVSHFLNGIMMILNSLGYPNGRGAVIAIRKDVFETVGGFDEKLCVAEDVDLFRRTKKFGTTGIINDVVYESSRRYRRKGYIRVFYHWIINGLAHMVFKKSTVTCYEEIR